MELQPLKYSFASLSDLFCLAIYCFIFLLPISGSSASGSAINKVTTLNKLEGGINYQIIHYSKGRFVILAPIKISSNTIIEGEGPDTVLSVPSDFDRYSQFVTNSDHKNGNANIYIRNLKIECAVKTMKGNGDKPGILRFHNVNNLNLQNLTIITDSNLYAIDFAASCRRSQISNCSITALGNGGCIMIRNQDVSKHSYEILVHDNKLFANHLDEPLAVFGWLGELYNVVLLHNNVNAVGASFGVTAYGVDHRTHTGKLHNIVIENNIITGGNVGGIGIKGGATNLIIRGNTVLNSDGDGIFLHAGGVDLPSVDTVSLLNNEIVNSKRHGVFATGTKITAKNNTVTKCGKSGFYVGDNIHVISNKVSNSSPGIFVAGINNVIEQNQLINAKIHVKNNANVINGNTYVTR